MTLAEAEAEIFKARAFLIITGGYDAAEVLAVSPIDALRARSSLAKDLAGGKASASPIPDWLYVAVSDPSAKPDPAVLSARKRWDAAAFMMSMADI